MKEACSNYLMVMMCVVLTIAMLFLIGFCIRVAWDELIKPIMDRIKQQKDEYWENRYHEVRDEYEECLHKLGGLLPSTIDAIIPGSVDTKVSHDNCEEYEERVLITFTVDTTDLFKEGRR